MRFKLISCMLLASILGSFIIGCNNIKKSEDMNTKIDLTLINKIKESQIGNFTRILYASEEKMIFYGVIGLIVYNFNDEKITNVVDLKSINMNHIQSDEATIFKVESDGDKILMYNENHTDNSYMYDVISGKLEKTELNQLENEYKLNYVDETEFLTKSEELEYSYNVVSINEKKVCYLSYPTDKQKGIEDLKIVVLDKETKDEKVFDVFN